ncbi:alpha/beta fold hydrolase [Streptomyces sp. CC208A]|uniref:thioesterase II family protein n=1 Tax=Streptomyces sp. CC208A TaxID=3044573 RepID=UPI0024A84541|nr:alpha/beta fold hydrolase [Streptomyces sp. CC208A]
MKSEWFRCYVPASENAARLICFPHAGGAASAYVTLARALAPDIEVVSVQYPGRQDRRREPAVTDLRLLAGLVTEAIGEPDRPYALFGHSMGAIVAHETARLLARRPVPAPLRLFLSGRGAPSPLRREAGPRDDAALLTEIRRLGGTDSALLDDPELLELAMPVLRADYAALGRYHWTGGPPLASPLSVLIGADDPLVTVGQAAAWREHTTASFELKVFPGGHFYLGDATDEVADVVSSALTARVA